MTREASTDMLPGSETLQAVEPLRAGDAHPDAAEIPPPAMWPRDRLELPSTYVAPRSELEARVARIWETVLGIAPIGVNDDFFDLGGESLHAFAVIGRVERDFAVTLKARDLFACATAAAMAVVISQRSSESGRASSVRQIGRIASARGETSTEPETDAVSATSSLANDEPAAEA